MISALAVLAVLAVAGLQQSLPTDYRIRIPADLQYAEVSATLPPGTTRLFMDSVQAEHLPEGWATFVRDLSARIDGRPAALTPLHGAAWAVSGGTEVTLTYRIDLGFTRTPWPAGNEQAGAAFGNALYVIGRPLFIVGNVTTVSRVEFVLPAEWQVSTPWGSTGSSGRAFDVPSVTELTRNALVVGAYPSVRLGSGAFDLELALPGQSRTVASLVEPVLQRVLLTYLDLFPDTPRTKYLMSFFRAAADDGEAFSSSASFTTTDSVTASNAIIWGNFLAHELMHFWNGQRIRGASPRASWRWLAEGFTEYYANVTLARAGVIAQDLFLKKAERHIGNYLYFATAPALPRMSLVEAGANTSLHRFGVYDGGWTAALCLDGLIREASGDRRSLDDFMRELWRQFGAAGRGYTLSGLDSLANDVAGSNLGSIVRAYAETREALPVAECLSRIGLMAATKGYAAEAFLFHAPNAAPAAAARGRAMYGSVRR
ncbi:MAG: hypothetical protein WD825_01400 [Gemmatimonadaceae bacterium]